jgi:hypothetical protein
VAARPGLLGRFGSRNSFGEGCRDRPEVIHLPAAAPTGRKPPVRLFVGSDTASWRAERALVWSVQERRDPQRAYEIHLLKDLRGFERSGWPSAFAGYRFAVPELAGGQGRALYLPVGRTFAADPAKLFDLDLGGAAMLENGSAGSPVLMDCCRLAALWPLDHLRGSAAHEALAAAVRRVGLVRPFPKDAPLPKQPWKAIEPAIDRAGFAVFTKARPSRRFQDLLALHQQMHEEGRPAEQRGPERTFNGKSLAEHVRPVAGLVLKHRAATILDFGAGKGALYQDHPDHPAGSRFKVMADWPGVTVTCFDPGYPAFAEPPSGRHDGVISTDVVEHIAADDIPWILDEIFGHAERFVYVVAACFPAKKMLPNGENAHVTIEPPAWWRGQMERAAARRPGVHWTLCAQTKVRIGSIEREWHRQTRGIGRR